jgi:hypothetical protein
MPSPPRLQRAPVLAALCLAACVGSIASPPPAPVPPVAPVAPDPLANVPELSPSRLLRRASLAIRGRLPELDEYDRLAAGTTTFTDFVEQYLAEDGSAAFADRTLKLYARRLSNFFVLDSGGLRPQGVGGGVVFRPRDMGHLGDARYVVKHICAGAPKSTGAAWNDQTPADYADCVLEAPIKEFVALMRKMALSASHPQKLTWLSRDWLGGYYGMPTTAIPTLTELYVAKEGYLSLVHYQFNGFGMLWGLGNDGEAGNFEGAFGLSPTIKEDSPQLLPGYYAGCLLPGETAPTVAELTAQNAAGMSVTAVDSAFVPMRSDALKAVPVHPWWDPAATVYACPGVAVAEAVQAGAIAAAPSTYRRDSARNDVPLALHSKQWPAMVDSVPVEDFLRDRYPLLGVGYGPHGAADYITLMFNYTVPPAELDQWHQCSANDFDTEVDPNCDCGPNLEMCNPLIDAFPESATLEFHAFFQYVVMHRRPFRDLLTAEYRLTDRAIEWQYFHRVREAQAMEDAQAHVSSMSNRTVADSFKPVDWRTKGTWPTGNLMQALDGLPALKNDYWSGGATSPSAYITSTESIDADLPADLATRFAMRSTPTGFPQSGVLTDVTFLSRYGVNRTRVNQLSKFFQCHVITPPASGVFTSRPEEATLPPRLQEKSGCAYCHAKLDSVASFYMGFGADNLNTNFYERAPDNQTVLRNHLGRMYLPEPVIATSATYYGQNPTTLLPDTWHGSSATEGVKGLAKIIGEEPGFTDCTVRRVWEVLLSRPPAAQEEAQIAAIVGALEGRPYTLQDVAKAIVTSSTFRKAN